ncbi:MAG: thioredoxin domain-containing protein, partial [Peptostreptococcus sp.]
MAKVINGSEFVQNVKEAKGLAVVDFFATWCGPCNMLGPVFADVAEANKDAAYFAKV